LKRYFELCSVYVRFDKELWDILESQEDPPQAIILEAVKRMFRYRDPTDISDQLMQGKSDAPVSVKNDEYVLWNGFGNPLHKDEKDEKGAAATNYDFELEKAKLELELEKSNTILQMKEDWIGKQDEIILELKQDKYYLQSVNEVLYSTFIPVKIGFLKSLLPPGRKAIQARQKIDEVRERTIVDAEYKVREKKKQKRAKSSLGTDLEIRSIKTKKQKNQRTPEKKTGKQAVTGRRQCLTNIVV
jgi:hypothetical protein